MTETHGLSGLIEFELEDIRLAWAALIDSAAFIASDDNGGLEKLINRSFASIGWEPLLECRDKGSDQGRGAAPLTVEVDRALQSAMDAIPKEGLIAVAASVRLPNVDLPCGGVMWVASRGDDSESLAAGPMSFPAAGLCMWAEPGAWCALAVCRPYEMAVIARGVVAGDENMLRVILIEAHEKRIATLLVVADGTGTPVGSGGVAYMSDGEESIISI